MGVFFSINPFLRTPTCREGQKSRCSTDWWIFIRCLSRFLSPSQSFPLACCVCLAVRLYGGVRGWALISVCLFIYISALTISICGGAQRGGFAGDNSPTLPVRSDGERVIFNRAQRLSGVSMPCSGRPDFSEMVPFYQLWHFYTEWTHSRCHCLE